MSDIRDYRRSVERSRNALKQVDRPGTFRLHGREWEMLPGVFSPECSPSTGIAMNLLGLGSSGPVVLTGSMLEVGCGAGVIAVAAALAGCGRVVATDISPEAVRTTARNVARHGVADTVQVRQGDLFAGLDPDERFDLIYWHSNYVLAPDDYDYGSMHERAYVDAGYRTHRRFLAEAHAHLNPGGSIVLHFSSRGDVSRLLCLAGEHGLGLRTLRSEPQREGSSVVEHMLIEVTRQPVRMTLVDSPARPARSIAA